MTDDTTLRYLALLGDFEDYLRTGYRSDRPTPSPEPSRKEALAAVAGEITVCARCALAGGVVAGLVESLNLRDWDNFWVPVVAGLVMEGFQLVGL